MSTAIPLETYKLDMNGKQIVWPADLTEDAYTLVYTHSNLSLNKTKKELDGATLYEAWAFDGKKSWHIWNRNGEWVCTVYDKEQDDPKLFIERGQLLLNHVAKTVGKEKLVIHERIAFDEHDQAYIAYACPIQLKD